MRNQRDCPSKSMGKRDLTLIDLDTILERGKLNIPPPPFRKTKKKNFTLNPIFGYVHNSRTKTGFLTNNVEI